MSDKPDLEPCPFCGSDMSSVGGMSPEYFAKVSDGTFAVNCDCGATGPSAKTIEQAIVEWNSRLTGRMSP